MSELIEFRCWNNIGQVMHEWDELVSMNKIDLLANPKPGYPVMRYVGIIGSDGVKVFGGDLIKMETGDIVHIFYSDSDVGYVGYVASTGEHEPMVFFRAYKKFKVVGNEYQNPDRLRESRL